MSSTSSEPAESITVRQTLDLLYGPFAPLAGGVADGRYAFWLGSGISRERLPDLRDLILRVLAFLHERIVVDDPNCHHRKALDQAVEMAGLRPEERERFDLDDLPQDWPVIDLVLQGLENRYSELLDIRVEGEDADYLLWDAVDVRSTYGTEVNRDCEHLCIGILALEGAISVAASANWDGLIEAALAELAGDADAVLRTVVLPDELREPERALTLLKFHGMRRPRDWRSRQIPRGTCSRPAADHRLEHEPSHKADPRSVSGLCDYQSDFDDRDVGAG